MKTTPRQSTSDSITVRSSRIEATVTAADLAAAAGISPTTLERLVRGGFVAESAAEPGTFEAAAAVRLTRMLRLRRDLGIGLTSASIIVDLLERLERMDPRLHQPGG